MHDCAFALLRIPRSVVSALAEEYTRPPRICGSSPSPRSLPRPAHRGRRRWRSSAGGCWLRITQTSPIMAQEMARLAVAVLLGTFPNSTMSSAHIPYPDVGRR